MKNFKIVRIGDLKKTKFTRYVWTDDRKNLEKNIIENGFDNQNHYLEISNDNYILNGNHRFEILKKNFEDDYNVKVNASKLGIKSIILISIIITIFFLPIVVFKVLRQEYKIRKNKTIYPYVIHKN
jgi:hypothetical protein